MAHFSRSYDMAVSEANRPGTTQSPKHRIMILGGGFGGVNTARHLEAAQTPAGRRDRPREPGQLPFDGPYALRGLFRDPRSSPLHLPDPRVPAKHPFRRSIRA